MTKGMKWNGLMQRMSRGRCPCHCDHRTDKLSLKDEKKRGKTGGDKSFSRDKHQVFLYFQNTTRNMKRVFCCKMECRSLFCFWKIQQQIANPKQRPQQQRAQKESFFQQKRDIVFSQSVKKEESVSLYWKWTIDMKISSKSRNYRKDVT